MKEISEIDKKEWEDLLSESKFSTFFHTWQFREMIEKAWPWAKPIYLKYSSGSSKAIAGFFRYKDTVVSLPFCEYSGLAVLSEKFDLGLFLEDISEYFKHSRIKVKLHPYNLRLMDAKTVRAAGDLDFKQNNYLSTFILEDLQDKSEEKLMKSFRKTTRHSIRYAEDEKLEIKDVETGQELRGFYKIYLMTMKKNKAPAAPYTSFEESLENKDVKMMIAKKDGRIIAGVTFLACKDFMGYSTSANHPGYRSHANYLLLWKGILLAKKKGVKCFDFGSTRVGSPLEVFKKGWGNVQYPITIYEKGFKEDHSKKSLARKIWGKMPLFIIEKMSDRIFRRMFG